MVGLGDVNNTSDLGKPISDATQTALNGKAPTSYANLSRNTIMEKLTVTDYLNTNLTTILMGNL